MSAISIQECSGQIYNRISSPVHHQSGTLCNNSHRYSLKVFLLGIAKEGIYIFGIYHYCHTFLRLRNSNFCTIQAGIFLRHLI